MKKVVITNQFKSLCRRLMTISAVGLVLGLSTLPTGMGMSMCAVIRIAWIQSRVSTF